MEQKCENLQQSNAMQLDLKLQLHLLVNVIGMEWFYG